MDAYVKTPTNPLDRLYTASCGCGWYRDFGRMGVTCERETEIHRARGPSHDITVVITETGPLVKRDLYKKLNSGRSRDRFRRVLG